MAEDVLKIPVLNLEIPKPKRWDFIALVVLLAGIVVAVVNVTSSSLSGGGDPISGTASLVFAVAQLAVCCLGLLVLGKTAKEGTIHGNLFALGAMGVGLVGMMLAAALWALF